MKTIDVVTVFFFVTLILAIAGSCWSLTQKWHACQKLYENKPAQVMCLLAK
jgi:hypothetical protein